MTVARTKKGHALLTAPHFIQPCLAQSVVSPPSGEGWLHEIKYDGYRVQAHIENGRVRIYTRNGLDWTDKFGSVVADFEALPAHDAILDGEAIVQNAAGVSDFSALVSEIKRGKSRRIIVMVFDLLALNGSDLRRCSLADRKSALQRVLSRRAADGLVRYSEHVRGDGAKILTSACEIGVEGIVSKREDAPYRSGRGGEWVKAKCTMIDSFVIIGYVRSKAVGEAIGSLVLGFHADKRIVYAGRVGTGFTADVAGDLWRLMQPLIIQGQLPPVELDREQRRDVVWVRPTLVARVVYRDWTNEKVLRHASFKGLRTDERADSIGPPLSIRMA